MADEITMTVALSYNFTGIQIAHGEAFTANASTFQVAEAYYAVSSGGNTTLSVCASDTQGFVLIKCLPAGALGAGIVSIARSTDTTHTYAFASMIEGESVLFRKVGSANYIATCSSGNASLFVTFCDSPPA